MVLDTLIECTAKVAIISIGTIVLVGGTTAVVALVTKPKEESLEVVVQRDTSLSGDTAVDVVAHALALTPIKMEFKDYVFFRAARVVNPRNNMTKEYIGAFSNWYVTFGGSKTYRVNYVTF